MRKILSLFCAVCIASIAAFSQSNPQIYDESLDPNLQITEALNKAAEEGKFVVAQLGGNWCKWCIRFARFVDSDPELKKFVADNYEFIHVNYNPRSQANNSEDANTARMLQRLGNPTRFGFPVLVVLDADGNILHIQDSALLESGDGYDKSKVIRFFQLWTPHALHNSLL